VPKTPFVFAPAKGHLANISLEIVRELGEEDVERLRSREVKPVYGPPPIRFLSARHRFQARALAAGKSVHEVAELTGVSVQLIYGLQKDQSFIELVSVYESQITDGYVEEEKRLYEKLLVAGETALDDMQGRLEGEPAQSQVPFGELRKTVELTMDRTVAPPKSADRRTDPPVAVTLNFGRTLTPREELQELKDVSPALPAPETTNPE
jgi:hypothetical protein